jgi:pilus assembly protein Flp/PilA
MYGVMLMRVFLNRLCQLRDDEGGAALVEYTVLLGILLIAVIATIIQVGNWVNIEWQALNGVLPGN